ncbi:MAG: ATP-binding protein, partial [Lachnospiraceae bacterium]|nr:ATP-binding protein [Lachnospiraceae bacterium]
VDLGEVVKEVFEILKPVAEQKNVTLSYAGESVELSGIRRYLYEIIYNLCDNAIRYNKEGGSVEVLTGQKEDGIILKVTDTGIGIPEEHQARVFERFYRVDKSHSKETGGTGLGLSIVKHAVRHQGGQIKLSSVPGEGTTVTVLFYPA